MSDSSSPSTAAVAPEADPRLEAARAAGIAWAEQVAARCREARRWPEAWPGDVASARRRLPGGMVDEALATALHTAAARRFAELRARAVVHLWRQSTATLLQLVTDGAARRGRGRLAPLDAADVITAWRRGAIAEAVEGAQGIRRRGPAWARFTHLVEVLAAVTRAVELAGADGGAALETLRRMRGVTGPIDSDGDGDCDGERGAGDADARPGNQKAPTS